MNHEFKDKVALVTGGLRGLGKAIVLSLAKRGATVTINDIKADNTEKQELLDQVKDLGGDGIFYQADVSNSKEVEEMFGIIKDKYSKLDFLINNAGTSKSQDIFQA